MNAAGAPRVGRVRLDVRHLQYSQAASPGTRRCCPGKYPADVKTRGHHPTVDLGASQTEEQLTSRLVNKAKRAACWPRRVLVAPERGTNRSDARRRHPLPMLVLIAPERGTNVPRTDISVATGTSSSPLRGVPT